MRKLSNCVSGCDFTTPLFISTDTVFQSDSKVSLQASFIAIFRYFSQTVIFVLLDWFVGLEASSGLSCFSVLFPLLTLSLQENKNTQLLCFAGVVIFTFKKKKFYHEIVLFFSAPPDEHTGRAPTRHSYLWVVLTDSPNCAVWHKAHATRPRFSFHSHHPPIRPEIHRLIRSPRLQSYLISLPSLSH